MDLTISILTYNRPNKLLKLLDSINSQVLNIKHEILIIDNSSNHDTKKIISTINNSKIKYIKPHDNLGVAKGRNLGFGLSKGNYILFLDDDVWFDNNYSIRRLYDDFIVSDYKIMTVNIHDEETNKLLKLRRNRIEKRSNIEEVLSFHGAVHIINKKEFLPKLYNFESTFGYEDLALSLEAHSNNMKIGVNRGVLVNHHEMSNFSGRKELALKYNYYLKKSFHSIAFYPVIIVLYLLRLLKNPKNPRTNIHFDVSKNFFKPMKKLSIITSIKLALKFGFFKVF